MTYDCNNCPFTCKGNKVKLCNHFLCILTKDYPVDARFPSLNDVQMNKSATQVMGHLMVMNGSGDQFSSLVHRMRANKYEDLEEAYYTQAIETETTIELALPTFSDWIGRHEWNRDQVRKQCDKASRSNYNSTGV